MGAHLLIRDRLSVVLTASDISSEPERIYALLIATPRNIFSWNFDLHRDDELVAHIDMAWFREAADVVIGGQGYTFLRESILQGIFALKQGDEVLVRAQKTSIFSRYVGYFENPHGEQWIFTYNRETKRAEPG